MQTRRITPARTLALALLAVVGLLVVLVLVGGGGSALAGLGLSADELSAVFADWNKSELNSFLIEITVQALRFVEAGGTFVPASSLMNMAAASGGKGPRN